MIYAFDLVSSHFLSNNGDREIKQVENTDKNNLTSLDYNDLPTILSLLKKYGGRKGLNDIFDELKELLDSL